MIEIESVPLCDVSFQSEKWLIRQKEIMHSIVQTLDAFRDYFPSFQSRGHVDLILADDLFIQDLNGRYRGKDQPTNVLSFPQEDLEKGQALIKTPLLLLGDIVMSYETLDREALSQNISFMHHFSHLLIHGLLHLLGFDHETDKDQQEMEALEAKILETLSIANPYNQR